MTEVKCKVAFCIFRGLPDGLWLHEGDPGHWGSWVGHAEYDIEESVEVYANQDGATYVFPQTATVINA